jgi:uncharacterized protein YjbI with pentapeptide repeats
MERFKEKAEESIDHNKPLECFGYYLPGINFAELLGGRSFAQPAYFNEATFTKDVNFFEATFSEVDFRRATFTKDVNFSDATFTKDVNFSDATFYGRAYYFETRFLGVVAFEGSTFSGGVFFKLTTFAKRTNFSRTKFLDDAFFPKTKFSETETTFFRYTIFEKPNKVTFDQSDLSKVSFADTDITRVRFGDKITWGGEDRITIIEEEWLTNRWEMKASYYKVSMEQVLSVYRNLRENYEFRLRYDDAGKFFIKEMELKRKYRHVSSKYELKMIALHRQLKGDKSPLPKTGDLIKNSWFSRHFSLTGLYYHLSRYGESISRPALIGVIIVFLSALFWVTQSNPILEPHFDPSLEATTSTFVGFREFRNDTQWLKAFERSFADFLPLLSLGGEIKVGIIDYIIKIVGGVLTFGLLAIALRRKFERKYTR